VTYADSSFLVSLYLEDQHTAAARRCLAAHGKTLILTSFAKAETQHAIRLIAFRKLITLGEMTQALIHLERAQDEGDFELRLNEPSELFQRVSQLSNRHALEHGVRFPDLLHIASAQLVKAKRFLTFDNRQQKLAETLGFNVKI